MNVEYLPYVDIQHDALSVLDDVEQGVVLKEDIWVSGYKTGESSVHGKARVTFQEGGGSSLMSRDGIHLERVTKSNFNVSIPALHLRDLPIRFPRHVLHPPYNPTSKLAPPLHVNALEYSPKGSRLVVGGPDGYCMVLPVDGGAGVEMKGHVGDVLDVKWFPSGEVVLTASSDLSVRIFGAADGINPRTLKGHTRAVTALAIIGVGRQVLSGSKDGSVRLWDVSSGSENRKWTMPGRGAVVSLVYVEGGLGDDAGGGVLVSLQSGEIVVLHLEGGPEPASALRIIPSAVEAGTVSFAYDESTRLLATGQTDGVIALRQLSSSGESGPSKLVRRNESPIYSLAFAPSQTAGRADLLVGTAAGLPCRLRVSSSEKEINVAVVEEYAGWEAVGVECWGVEPDGGVWSAGGEGGLRRY